MIIEHIGLLCIGVAVGVTLCFMANIPKIKKACDERNKAKAEAKELAAKRKHEECLAKINAEAAKFNALDDETKAMILKQEHEKEIKKMEVERDKTIAKLECEAKRSAWIAGSKAVVTSVSAFAKKGELNNEAVKQHC